MAAIELSPELKVKLIRTGLGYLFDREPDTRRANGGYVLFYQGLALKEVQKTFSDMVTVGREKAKTGTATAIVPAPSTPGVRVDFWPVAKPYVYRRVAPLLVAAFIGGAAVAFIAGQ